MVIIMFNELKVLDAKKLTEKEQRFMEDQLSKFYPELKTSKHFSSKKALLNASHSELVEEFKSKLVDGEIIDSIIDKMNFPENELEHEKRNEEYLETEVKMAQLLTNNIEVFAVMNSRGNYDLFADICTSRIYETSFTTKQSDFTITMLDGSKLKPFKNEYRQQYSFNNKPEKKLNDVLLSDELKKYMRGIITTNNAFSNGSLELLTEKSSQYFGNESNLFKVSFKTISNSCDLKIDEVVREAQEVQNVMKQCNEFLIQNNMYKD